MTAGNGKLARYIDHTLLKPESTADDIARLCEEARRCGFFSVCVPPCYVKQCAAALADSQVKVCTVVGFPLGANVPAVKAFEAREAIDHGADEIDMVINIGALKSGDIEAVRYDIASVLDVAREHLLKVILETCLLSDDEIVAGCEAAAAAGAHFVKTSTGFSSGGATIEHVALMRRTVGPDIGVKASGGVRDAAAARAMIAAGATRLGTSAGLAIVGEAGAGDGGAY
ncbi:MAG: deoxyribose-phosphate aldolase [Gammaproteobacteria bacterium]|nr:deoxyribose-phosphate aldolase [Gammaproteobacteria bacterium]